MGGEWRRRGTDEATEATLTLDHLYTLYRYTYRQYDHGAGRSLAFALRLAPVARAVAELAECDAQDGKPLRSLSEFRLALAHGAGALGPLGWSAA
jgi:hypothetical protein